MFAFPLFVRPAAIALLALAMLPLAGCSSAEDRARSHFERGQELVNQGDAVRASLEFRNALQLRATYPDALLALAKVQEQQGAYADAARSFMTVAEQAPTNVEARIKLSYILVAAGQLDEADKYIKEAAALAATDPAVLVAQATMAIKRGNRAEGVKLAETAFAADPQSVDALMVLASERLLDEDPAGARGYLDKAPADSDSNLGLQIMKLAALEALDDQPAVEALFVKLNAQFPDNATFRDGLVRWYLAKERNDDAERVIRQHAAAEPSDDQAQLTLAAFLASFHGNDKAVADLETAIAERTRVSGDTYALRVALAQLKLQSGQATAAVDLMQAVVDETTDAKKRDQARVQLARMFTMQSRNDEAEAMMDTVLTEDARNVEALSVRASLRLLKGNTTDAIADLLQALNEAPDNATLHGLLAEAYERDGSVVLAEEQYSKALDLTQYAAQTGLPIAQFFLRYGKTDQALRALELMQQREPQNRAVLNLLAQLKLSTEDWTGARQIAETLRQLGNDPNTPDADRIAAAALIGAGRAGEAIALLQDAVANGSSQAVLLPQLITAYMRDNQPDGARDYLLGILEEHPDDIRARTLLGSVYSDQGQADLAEAAFRAAADIQPGLEGETALANYYLSVGKSEAAQAVVTAGLEQDPASWALQQMQANLDMRAQRFDDAIAVYEKLYAQDQTVLSVANDLASLLSERRNDPASLQRAFEIAQRLRGSEVPQYLDTLGWIYYLRSEYDAALPLLRNAANRLTDNPLIHLHLGMTYSALGQKDLAQASLERALSIKPALLEADAEKAKAALRTLGDGDAAEVVQKS